MKVWVTEYALTEGIIATTGKRYRGADVYRLQLERIQEEVRGV